MKKILFFALFAALTSFSTGCAEDFATVLNDKYYGEDAPSKEPDITEQTIKLGCYNLWISGKGTGEYIWTSRRSVLAQSIIKNKWDVFGFQEVDGTIKTELPKLVEQQGGKYEWWFVGRDTQDGVGGESLGIAYNPDRFELSDKHFFWISPTPDILSYGWDEVGYRRIAACATVTDKRYNKQFFLMVTHSPLAATARAEGAKLLVEREKMYNPDGIPSILVGDMNAEQEDASSKTFRTHWQDSYLSVDPDFAYGPVGTFNGHKVTADLSQASARIDYIYSRGDMELKAYRVDNTVYGNIYPSDHCPLSLQFDTNYEKPAPDVVEGSGTAADPWQINSVSDWNVIAASINGQEADAVYAPTAHYKLTSDIDFSKKSFTPIAFLADNLLYFEGEFDGGGFSLKNLMMSAAGKSFGVFGANKGVIRNLAVDGSITSEFETVGGVVGTNAGLVDGATFKGNITGGASTKTIGGIAGQNKGTIVNCANLGGTLKTAVPKDPNMGGIVGQVSKLDAAGNYIINCYSWVEKLETVHNNVGGVVGIVSDNSIVVNCYATIEKIDAGSSYGPVAGYSKVGNLQNIYGNVACESKAAVGSAIGSDKNAGTTIWKTTAFGLLSLDNMKTGAVSVPSSKESCANFVAALNAGVKIYNETPEVSLPVKPAVTLREWEASGTYPVLKK